MKNLQKELEELSLEFIVEADKEEEGIFLEESDEEEEEPMLRDEIEEDENLYSQESSEDIGSDDKFYNIYSNDNPSFFDNNINNLNRNSGIIFDEAKLENARIQEWSKAPKLKESVLEKFGKIIYTVLVSFFSLIKNIISSFFIGLSLLIKKLFQTSYWLIKNLIIFPWRLLLAFKEAFVYLFGDFSWLKRKQLEPVVVKEIDIEIKPFNKWKAIGGFVMIAFIIILPFQIYNSYQQGSKAKGRIMGATSAGIEYLKQAGISGSELDFNSASNQFDLAKQEFGLAQNSFQELDLVTNKLAEFIPEVKTGQKLLLIAKSAAEIGQSLSKVGTVFEGLEIRDNGEKVGGNFELSAVNSELELALSKANIINNVLPTIELGNMGTQEYQEKLENIKNQLPALISYLEKTKDVFEIITYILGADEPKRLMLVFQNNSELRPTGGFMGSYAIVDIKNGQIQNIEVPGGGFYDLKGSLTTQVDAPYPFHLFSPIWQPWNANWFADWPSSAEKIMWFYEKSGGSTVDAVISFTPNILEDLLALTGEIEMPEYETNIDNENFVRMTQIEVELEYDKEENKPKQFIGDLMPKVLEKILALKDEKLLEILQIITDAIQEKHLLIYLNNEKLQNQATEFGWTGNIKNTTNDYLSVIDTNIAGGKTDRVVKTKIAHQAEVLEDGFILNTVTITKTHKGNPKDVFEGHTNTSYIRFYVPKGSKLISTDGFDPIPTDREFQIATLDEVKPDPHLTQIETNLEIDEKSNTRITNEFNKTCFANWMIVKPGKTKMVTISYLLPLRLHSPKDEPISIVNLLKKYFFNQKITTESQEYIYSLLVQKQPGTDNEEFSSIVSVGKNWEIGEYLPKMENMNLAGSTLEFNSDLKVDRFYGAVLKSQ